MKSQEEVNSENLGKMCLKVQAGGAPLASSLTEKEFLCCS